MGTSPSENTNNINFNQRPILDNNLFNNMDLTKQQLINVVGFLSRVQLTGNEVPAFNELTKIFQDEYAKTKP